MSGLINPQGLVVLCRGFCCMVVATLVLSMGTAAAQDLEAVERKLGEAVAEGHLSLEHAQVMMEALRRATQDQKAENPHAEERIERWVGEVGERIKSAIERGDLTEEEGWAKWIAFKTDELWPKLAWAVKEGAVSERWAAQYKQGIERAEVGERLKSAVARGEMTEDEAREKWEAYLQGAEGDERPAWLDETLERFRREIASRSVEENRRELKVLRLHLRRAQEAGNEGRIKILSIEIEMIEDALEAADD